jgi:hypothetical protein
MPRGRNHEFIKLQGSQRVILLCFEITNRVNAADQYDGTKRKHGRKDESGSSMKMPDFGI